MGQSRSPLSHPAEIPNMRGHHDSRPGPSRRRFFALAGAGTAAACLPAPAAPAPKNVPAPGGLFVLDDCDPDYRGKDAYHDRFTRVDESGGVKFRLDGFNNCQEIGSPHRIAVDRERGWVWV